MSECESVCGCVGEFESVGGCVSECKIIITEQQASVIINTLC